MTIDATVWLYGREQPHGPEVFTVKTNPNTHNFAMVQIDSGGSTLRIYLEKGTLEDAQAITDAFESFKKRVSERAEEPHTPAFGTGPEAVKEFAAAAFSNITDVEEVPF